MKFNRLARWLLPFILVTLMACAAPRTRMPHVSQTEMRREAYRQRILALKTYAENNSRLMDVSFKLKEGAVNFCENKAMFSGYLSLSRDYFKGEYRDAAIELFDLRELSRVVHVVKDSPAHKAGLKVGDEILSIEGKAFPSKPEKVRKLMESLPDDARSLKMTVLRNASQLPIEMLRSECCDYDVVLMRSDEVNAWADGKKVYIAKGLMRVVDNDTELATIVAHELAHNIREHINMMKKNRLAGGLGGLLVDMAAALAGVNTSGEFTKLGAQAGQMAYSKDMEREADYVGLYILALGGYNYKEGPDVFRKLGSSNPGSIEVKWASSHPSTPERYVALEKAVEEIDRKKAEGLAFLPEEKEETPPPKNYEKDDNSSGPGNED